jgi:hypothetical protein
MSGDQFSEAKEQKVRIENCGNCKFLDKKTENFGFCNANPPKIIEVNKKQVEIVNQVSVNRKACRFYRVSANNG